jgi:hypothetical protein
MAPAQRVVPSPSGAESLSALQIRVALLCGLIQMLDGYDLSTIGLAAPTEATERIIQAVNGASTRRRALSSAAILAIRPVSSASCRRAPSTAAQ